MTTNLYLQIGEYEIVNEIHVHYAREHKLESARGKWIATFCDPIYAWNYVSFMQVNDQKFEEALKQSIAKFGASEKWND